MLESHIESKVFVARLTADVAQAVLGMLVRQGPTLDRRQGLQNVQVVCVVHIAVFQVQTMQESQMLTMAVKEKEESQQKVRTWTLTPKGRQEEVWLLVVLL